MSTRKEKKNTRIRNHGGRLRERNGQNEKEVKTNKEGKRKRNEVRKE